MRVFYLSPSLNIIARTAKLTDAADKYVAEKICHKFILVCFTSPITAQQTFKALQHQVRLGARNKRHCFTIHTKALKGH